MSPHHPPPCPLPAHFRVGPTADKWELVKVNNTRPSDAQVVPRQNPPPPRITSFREGRCVCLRGLFHSVSQQVKFSLQTPQLPLPLKTRTYSAEVRVSSPTGKKIELYRT